MQLLFQQLHFRGIIERIGLCVSRCEAVSEVEEVLLDEESVVGCKTYCGLVNVTEILACLGNGVLIGVCEELHDEDSVCQFNSAVAVCIAILTACVR